MEILVLSDSHGHTSAVRRILDAHGEIGNVLFLGDGIRDMEWLEDAYPERRFYSVRGNCDMGSYAATEGLAPFEGTLLFYTHGHLYNVKSSRDTLAHTAQEKGADIALYGHTHVPAQETLNEIAVCNPGAVCNIPPCYAVLTVQHGQTSFVLHTL